MSNMTYCKYRNTLKDLRDCYDSMYDETSPEEDQAKMSLIKLCKQIAEENED